MEKLIECAKKLGAEFEIYYRTSENKTAKLTDGKLRDMESGITSGVSLRIIKDGKLGFAYTKNLDNPQELADNALSSLKAGVAAKFSFPTAKPYRQLETYSPKAEAANTEMLAEECLRVSAALGARSKGMVCVYSGVETASARIINSAGTDITLRSSEFGTRVALVAGGGDEYMAGVSGLDFQTLPDAKLDTLAAMFETCRNEMRPQPGKRNVLFMPEATYMLLWRLQSGTNGQNLLQKATPLAGREGEKIFSETVTLKHSPLNDSIPGARPVDDEGVPCFDSMPFKDGVFTGFHYDLACAGKAGVAPTGHGFRRLPLWGGGDPATIKPVPALPYLHFAHGGKSFEELLSELGSGLVVFGVLGAHSGNIPNGDFSVGLAPAACVENGRIVGKAKDTMISGNVYELLKRPVSSGCGEPVFANNPPLLVEGVTISN
jgi:PmbA protein